ncbi:MAG: haloacid dehalogenase-like hydrolase [Erysipelotrichaceae bacterium]|nr:haloacid dehalogenase-like hydrolase [Erysipelotrichaceae bacterium]
MHKRILNCFASDFLKMSSFELLEAIAGSEGRVLAGECVSMTQPLGEDITNAEMVAAMGADLIILNIFDVDDPVIRGLPECEKSETIRTLKKLTGRPIAINLEPAKINEEDCSVWALSSGRTATPENARKAVEMGVDMIVLTGNPGNGVSNEAIIGSIKAIREDLGNSVILAAGKMHASGILKEGAEAILSVEEVEEFAKAGADIILMPSPGTVPGVDIGWVKKRVEKAHELGKLTLTAIGTSQEGADTETIRRIALMAKQTGTDIHHIGDSGYLGMALPENIIAYSIVIRGVRHTYHRMAASINR